jgi:hypothetical protein
MRYLKGSIQLGDRDLQLLEIVANASKITQPQLFELSTLKNVESQRKMFERRLRRLTNAGLLKREQLSFLGSRLLYSITKEGICGLEEGGIHLLSVYVERENDVNHQIRHSLELNRAHIALLKVDSQLRWTPAKAVRVMNRSGYRPYAKTYDAVASIMVDYQFHELGIEYERTLKASEKYQELLQALEAEKRLDVILYLFPDRQIGSALQWIFRNARKEVVLAQQEEFVHNPLDTPATCRYLTTTLRDCLRRSSCQKAAPVTR